MAPKAAPGREIALDGLPPGWKCIEKTYQTGGMAGQTYMRFASDRHRNVLSLKAAIKLHAEDSGKDPDEALRDYERQKEEKRAEAAKVREERGHLKGEKRQESIERFRAVHGKLDGATVICFPGWRGESKVLENCGQICASYYDPEGRVFKLVNDIEAYLGQKMMAGEEIPDINEARNGVERDEKGKPINMARRGDNVEDLETQAKRRKREQQTVGTESYRECTRLSLVQVEAAEQGQGPLQRTAQDVRRLLLARGFERNTRLLALSAEPRHEVLDALAGLYYQLAEPYNERPCFQRVLQHPSRPDALACKGQYIFWSTVRDSWKLGNLDDKKIGLAFCAEDKPEPTGLERPWHVLQPGLNDPISQASQ